MITELNPIYAAAWDDATNGTGGFHYLDPDKVETSGKTLVFPCLFRLLRTSDTLTGTRANDRYTRSESFLACITVGDFPDVDEEKIENRLLGMVQAFIRALREDSRLSVSVPTNYRWYRRTLQQFAICLNFDMSVSVIAEDWRC